jgi:Rod binding domain-containing protein
MNFSGISTVYETQSVLNSAPKPKAPPILQAKTLALPDIYERADGSEVVRQDRLNEETPMPDEEKRFRDVLHQFVGQTLFGQMLKSMRATQEKNPYFHGGRAEEIFQSQLDMVLTDKMTQATSKTLSEPMYKLMKASKMNG